MAQASDSTGHLNAYERAVCYYTIPRVTSPMTGGLVIAYAVVLFEAIGLLVYGVVREQENLVRWGGILTVTAIVFGIVVFFFRSLRNAVSAERALAQAGLAPDEVEAADDLPDPFEGHLFLRCRRRPGENTFAVEDNDGEQRYAVTVGRHDKHFTLDPMPEGEAFEVEAFKGGDSFSFDFSRHPGRVLVHRGETQLAHSRRRYSFMDRSSDIFVHHPEEMHYVTRGGAIFRNDRLVGRIYTVRQFTYLDIESQSFHDGILGYFVAMA